jgi:hypothetical protein
MATKLDLDLITRETAANFAAVSLLPKAEFARQPNKGTDGKKPKCKPTSHSCGFSCISGEKTCRISMSMEQQQAAKALKKELRAAKKESKTGQESEVLTDNRDPKLSSALAAFDEKIEAMRSLAKAAKAAKDAYYAARRGEEEDAWAFDDRKEELRTARYNAEDAFRLAGREAETVAESVLTQLKKRTPAEALALVESANLEYYTHKKGNAYRPMAASTIKARKKQLAEVVELTGEMPPTLKTVLSRPGRAFASEDGLVMWNGGDGKNTVYHEFAHHVEFSNSQLKAAAGQWRDNKAESPDLRPMAVLTANDRYARTEVGVKDNYIDPYVGKVYKDGSTEVVSVGLEHFADTKRMVTLRLNAADHFDFVLKEVLKV